MAFGNMLIPVVKRNSTKFESSAWKLSLSSSSISSSIIPNAHEAVLPLANAHALNATLDSPSQC